MNYPFEGSSWLDMGQIQNAGYSVEELMDQSHDFLLSREPDAGASSYGYHGCGVWSQLRRTGSH